MATDIYDWLDDLVERGLEAEDADALRQLLEASPVRKERDEWKAKALRHRDQVVRSELRRLGVTADPATLRVPDDLDPLDGEQVRNWAETAGLVEAPPPAA